MDLGHNTKKIKTYGKKRTERIVCVSAWDNNLDPSKSSPLAVASNAEPVRNGKSLEQHDDGTDKENAVDVGDERAVPIVSRPPKVKPAKPRANKTRPPKKDTSSLLSPLPSRHTKKAVKPTRITKVAKLHYDTPRTPLASKHTNILALGPNIPTFKKLAASSPLKARHTTPNPTPPSPFAPDVCSTPNTHVDSLFFPLAATPDARSAPRFRTPPCDSPLFRRRTSIPISPRGEAKSAPSMEGVQDRLELSTTKGNEGGIIPSSSFLALPVSPILPISSPSSRPPILPASVPISPILAVTSSTPISSSTLSSASDVDSLVESMDLRLSFRRSLPEIIAPHLRPLLEECGQRRVGSFEEMLGEATLTHATKLGEATFAEVFSIPSEFISSTSPPALSSPHVSRSHTHEHPLVLKIVPFGSGDRVLVNGLPQAECEDVLQEVVVTRGMAEVEGFIGVERVAVCCGTYPERLLQEWDRWDEENGSENDRPDYFPSTQLYCVLVLEHGGSDLEHAKLRNWRQAAAVFWQVATAIAVGEEQHCFEHRDLHWGNVLLRPLNSEEDPGRVEITLENGRTAVVPTHGVRACVIDYTLSRMKKRVQDDESVVYRELVDLFDGEGDYQFDIYRLMLSETKDDWRGFHPRTNVLWLHYLVDKLLFAKQLRKPRALTSRTRSNSGAAEEIKSYEALVKFREAAVRNGEGKGRGRGRGKSVNRENMVVGFESARDVVAWGIGRGAVVLEDK